MSEAAAQAPSPSEPGHWLFDMLFKKRVLDGLAQFYASKRVWDYVTEKNLACTREEFDAAEQAVYNLLQEAGFDSDFIFTTSGNGHLTPDQERALELKRVMALPEGVAV